MRRRAPDGGRGFHGALAAIAAAILVATQWAACAPPPSRTARGPEVETPTPTRTPPPRTKRRPRPTLSATPGPSPIPIRTAQPPPLADVTREPLTRGIAAATPTTTARSLETAERARIELQHGTTGRAIELADEALRLAPTAPALVVRARALLAEGSPELARADLDRAAKLSPNPAWRAEIVAVTGATREAEGNLDAALTAYRQAVVIFPANQTARDGLRRLSSP
jgi:hypothetical protein